MKLSLVAAASTVALLSLVACSSSQEGSSGAVPEATEQPGTQAAPSATGETTGTAPGATADAGTVPVEAEQDAGLITDGGGGNPDEEPDAAVVTVDAGADAGTVCGPASGNGASLSSACSSGLTIALGGVVQPGSYDLAGFVVLGTQAYCAAYKASTYSGRLDVASDGQGGFVFGERVVKTGGLSPLAPNKSFKVTTQASALMVTQSCGAKIASASWKYSVSSEAGKPVIFYTHDSGTATVRYKWVMR